MLSTAVGSLPRALPPWGQLTDCFYRMLLSFIESGLCCNLSLVFLIVPLSSMSSVHNLLLSSDHLMCLPHSLVLIGIPQGPVKADYRAVLSEFLTNSRARLLGGSAVGHLPWAQVMIPDPNRVPHRVPCGEPASPSACVSASLFSVSLMKK